MQSRRMQGTTWCSESLVDYKRENRAFTVLYKSEGVVAIPSLIFFQHTMRSGCMFVTEMLNHVGILLIIDFDTVVLFILIYKEN